MMCRSSVLGALLMAAAATTSAQVADSTVVIEASGLGITKAEFEELTRGDQRYAGAAKTPEGRRALANEFGKAFALEAEARRRKVDESPEAKLKIRHATQQILAYEMVLTLRRGYLKNDAALAAQYEKNRDLYAEPRVRQILIRTQGSEVAARPGQPSLSVDEARAKAQALRSKLASGADFAALAKAESDDLGSRDRGGDIGIVRRGSTPADFEAVAFSLPVGTVSDVFATAQGLHIIVVEERKAPPLSEVKAMVANDLAHRDMEAIIRNGYKINEAYFSR